MTSPITGDTAFLGSMLATLQFFAVIGDGNSPPMIQGSFELAGTTGTVTLAALVGPPGPPGEPSPIVKVQFEQNFTSPSQLPNNLTNTPEDIGKAWWIGNVVFMWSGTAFFQKQMGVPGPPGPVPDLEFEVQLVPSGTPTSLATPVAVTSFGDPETPTVLIQFDQDSITGPPGPSGPIVDASDFDSSLPLNNGDAIVWNAALQSFGPSAFAFSPLIPYFSVPEGAFNSFAGEGTQQLICTFAIPQQPFDFIPIITGHINAAGLALQANPLQVGCAVYLGSPIGAGQLIARGFGNISNETTLVPHFSTPTTPNTAVGPTSSTGVVPAFAQGTQGTIFVYLVNEGAIGAFAFNSSNAQLFIQCLPTSDVQQPEGSTIFGGRGRFSATCTIIGGS
jgi:hypothetical protein